MSIATSLLSDRAARVIRCPACGGCLRRDGETWICLDAPEDHLFPGRHGRPVLINEAASAFRFADVTGPTSVPPRSGGLKRRIIDALPELGENRAGRVMLDRMRSILSEKSARPLVLVIGGATPGAGFEQLAADSSMELVETDVIAEGRTHIVCDGHDLPFADDSFDGVVIQAVLQVMADPYRCVSEIWRVLKPGGLVYADTSFMQQVCNGDHDFTRFTHLGHRRLFRWFREIESGPVGGPGIALSWSIQYFLFAFADGRRARNAIAFFTRAAFFWLKYVDRRLGAKAQVFDAGWAYFFLGAKADVPVSDRDLPRLYRGYR